MRTLNDYFISGRVADISTAGSTFVAVPDGGRIIKIMTVLQGAISGGNAAITFEIGGTAVTGADITVAHSGSAVVLWIHLYQQHSTELKRWFYRNYY